MRIRLLIFAAILTLMSSFANAQSTQPASNLIRRTTAGDATAATQPAATASFETARVVLALAAVLGLIFLLRAGLKRFSPGTFNRSSEAIRVIGKTHLSPRQQVIVLQVGRRVLVVGDSGGQLNTLCEINDIDEAALLLSQMTGGERPAARESFAQTLVHAEEQFDSAKAPTPPTDPAIDTARTELNGLAEKIRVLSRHLKRA